MERFHYVGLMCVWIPTRSRVFFSIGCFKHNMFVVTSWGFFINILDLVASSVVNLTFNMDNFILKYVFWWHDLRLFNEIYSWIHSNSCSSFYIIYKNIMLANETTKRKWDVQDKLHQGCSCISLGLWNASILEGVVFRNYFVSIEPKIRPLPCKE